MAKLWLRSEVFHGVLPVQFSQELGPDQARQVVSVLRESSNGVVHYAAWVTASWRILKWSEPFARLFWEMTSIFHGANSSGLGSEVESQQELPIASIAIFLLLHIPEYTSSHVQPAPAASFNEVWPAEVEDAPWESRQPKSPRSPRSPRRDQSPPHAPVSPSGNSHAQHSSATSVSPRSPSSARALCLQAVSSAESHRLSSVREHIVDFLRLISSDPRALEDTPLVDHTGSPGHSQAQKPAADFSVSSNDLNAMKFIIAGGMDLEKQASSLSELTPWWGESEAESAAAKPMQEVVQWLSSSLCLNEVLYPTASMGNVVSPSSPEQHGISSTPADLKTVNPRKSMEAKPAPAATASPRLVNSVVHHTVILRPEQGSEEQTLCDLNVMHCHDAHLYLLEPYRFATVMGCTDCTIVVGAVGGMLRVVGCERIHLVVACRRLYISSCVDSTFPVFTTMSPVLAGDNRGCQFAPYNTGYAELESHLERAGLPTCSPPSVNHWNSPIDLTSLANPLFPSVTIGSPSHTRMSPSPPRHSQQKDGDSLPDTTSAALLPPSQFHTVVIPSKKQATPEVNPFAIPPEYAQVLDDKLQGVRALQLEVQRSGDSDEKRAQIEDVIQAHFAEWLVSSGNLRQVLDLSEIDRSAFQDAASQLP